jgi:hypothetical protein
MDASLHAVGGTGSAQHLAAFQFDSRHWNVSLMIGMWDRAGLIYLPESANFSVGR